MFMILIEIINKLNKYLITIILIFIIKFKKIISRILKI